MTALAEKTKGIAEGAAVFDVGAGEKVVVEVVGGRGRAVVNARLWVDDDGEWRPRRGLTLAPELAESVGQAMVDKAREVG